MHAKPAARADVGRHKVVLGFIVDKPALRPLGGSQPERDAAIAVMIDDQGGERLAGNLVVRRAMGNAHFAAGQPKTDFVYRSWNVLLPAFACHLVYLIRSSHLPCEVRAHLACEVRALALSSWAQRTFRNVVRTSFR